RFFNAVIDSPASISVMRSTRQKRTGSVLQQGMRIEAGEYNSRRHPPQPNTLRGKCFHGLRRELRNHRESSVLSTDTAPVLHRLLQDAAASHVGTARGVGFIPRVGAFPRYSDGFSRFSC